MARRRRKTVRKTGKESELDQSLEGMDFGDLSFGLGEKQGKKGGTPEDREVELTDLQKAFREARTKELKNFQLNTDSEYWFCVCFPTREQKDAFLQKVGWMDEGDKYLDGMEIAERMGIEIEEPTPNPRWPKPHKRWLKHVSPDLDKEPTPEPATS